MNEWVSEWEENVEEVLKIKEKKMIMREKKIKKRIFCGKMRLEKCCED